MFPVLSGQLRRSKTFTETKTTIKTRRCSKWVQYQPRYDSYLYNVLVQGLKLVTFLRDVYTGYNRLNHHHFIQSETGK